MQPGCEEYGSGISYKPQASSSKLDRSWIMDYKGDRKNEEEN